MGPRIRICDSALSLNKAMLRQILILRRFVRYFFVQGKLHKKCHSFPSHLSLYFIKYASSILFLKILKYYNSTILYKSPKNPIFVQLSPIKCTYSNIFIRFFKFFPANTNIYQISYRVIGALCGLRQGVLSSRAQRGNDIKCVARDNVKKVCRLCYYFSANKRLLCSVRSTLSF